MVSFIPHVVRFRIELKWRRGLFGLGGVGKKPAKRFRFRGLVGLEFHLFLTTLNPGEDKDKMGFPCFQKRPCRGFGVLEVRVLGFLRQFRVMIYQRNILNKTL